MLHCAVASSEHLVMAAQGIEADAKKQSIVGHILCEHSWGRKSCAAYTFTSPRQIYCLFLKYRQCVRTVLGACELKYTNQVCGF